MTTPLVKDWDQITPELSDEDYLAVMQIRIYAINEAIKGLPQV